MKVPRISIAIIEVGTSGEEGVSYLRVKGGVPDFPHPREDTWEQQGENEKHLTAVVDRIKGVLKAALEKEGFTIKEE